MNPAGMNAPHINAIVTGCAGFIGAHLTERLLQDGWNVTGIDVIRPYYSPDEKLASLDRFRFHPRFNLVESDLATAPLDQLFAERPLVFHLAAQPGVRGSFGETFDQYVHDNVIATQRLFEAAVAGGVPRVVYASSSSVYGNAAAYPCVEATTPTRPLSPYGVTKATCEHLAQVYREQGLDAVGLRYFTVYGPSQRPDMAMRRLCEAALGGPVFQLFGDGLQSRDFTHVNDAVEATILAGMVDRPAPVINIGGGQEATLLEVIETISSLAGPSLVSGGLSIERAPAQTGDVRRTGADTTLARSSLGWEPKVVLGDGLLTELEWVRQRRQLAEGQSVLRPEVELVAAEDRA